MGGGLSGSSSAPDSAVVSKFQSSSSAGESRFKHSESKPHPPVIWLDTWAWSCEPSHIRDEDFIGADYARQRLAHMTPKLKIV
eukprot:353843-Chlamydomonas_euryale.AAC.11